MSPVQIAMLLPLVAVWPAVMLSGLATGSAPVLVPAGLAMALTGSAVAYYAVRSARWALMLMLVVVVALSINFRVRDYGAAGLDWQNGLKLATWALMALVCCANWRNVVTRWRDPVVAPLTMFVGVACISASYSVVPAYSAACALSLVAYLGFACVLAEEFDERRLLHVLIGTLTAYLLLNWIVTAVVPEIGIMESAVDGSRMQGVSGHPNSLARQANVFLALILGAYCRGHLARRMFWPLLALGAITILSTGSRTSLLAVVMAAILVALRARHLLLPGLATVLAIAVLTFGFVDLGTISRSGDSGELLTLTGRTELWSFVLEKIGQHPLLGHGLNSFEATAVDEWFGNRDAGVATHNNFLEVLFSCGIIGFVPFILAMALLGLRWLRRPNVLRDLFMLDMLITGLTEVDIALAVVPTFMLFLLVALDAKDEPQVRLAWRVKHV